MERFRAKHVLGLDPRMVSVRVKNRARHQALNVIDKRKTRPGGRVFDVVSFEGPDQSQTRMRRKRQPYPSQNLSRTMWHGGSST
jgi:hypothetical protein